jgi:hypothetical protein
VDVVEFVQRVWKVVAIEENEKLNERESKGWEG